MKQHSPAHRTQKVSYAIRDIIVEAQKHIPAGMPILPLNIGDPCAFDFKTPPHLIEAARNAFDALGGYAPSEGLPEAREAVARFQNQFGLQVQPADTLITTGGAEGIQLILQAVINPGDGVLLPAPGYPAYDAAVNFLEGTLQYYYLDEKNDWQIDPAKLESKIDSTSKALILMNPNNPSGAILTKETLGHVLAIAKKHSLVVIADEQVYPFYTYDGNSIPMCATVRTDVPIISIGSMSKTYLMPGWRLGWMVFFDPTGVLGDIKETVFRLKRIQLGSPHPLQKAIPAALDGPREFIDETVMKLKIRRDIVFEGVNAIPGFSLVKPEGAFYAFIKIDLPIPSDKQFVLDLACKTGILCVPGSGFGQENDTYHMRWVFLPPEDILRSALSKLTVFMQEYPKGR